MKLLPDAYDRQLAALGKLEGAETKMLKLRIKAKVLKEKKDKHVEVQRPTHKLGFLGLWGEKVDTIDWAQKEILETKEILDQGRRDVAHQTEDDPGAVQSEIDEEDLDEDAASLRGEFKGTTKGVVSGVGKGAKTVIGTGKFSCRNDQSNLEAHRHIL